MLRPLGSRKAARVGVSVAGGTISLPLPAGWRTEPASRDIALAKLGDEVTVEFTVSAPANATPIEIAPVLDANGKRWSFREDVIDYPHVPMQVVLQPGTVRLVPLAIALPQGPVGYIAGSGDTIADDLAHVGMSVAAIDDATLRSGDLGRFRAIVVGIRAYNTRPAVRAAHERLMQYVFDGGTLVVQYNTNNRIAPLTAPIGPWPFDISQKRVTDETAPVACANLGHPALTTPNRIDGHDFEGWVQERGLYFADKWDPRYETPLAMRDPGEPAALSGGLLWARHGKGVFVYTGLAFFRQLPAGVPGAYRLFANLLAPPASAPAPPR